MSTGAPLSAHTYNDTPSLQDQSCCPFRSALRSLLILCLLTIFSVLRCSVHAPWYCYYRIVTSVQSSVRCNVLREFAQESTEIGECSPEAVWLLQLTFRTAKSGILHLTVFLIAKQHAAAAAAHTQTVRNTKQETTHRHELKLMLWIFWWIVIYLNVQNLLKENHNFTIRSSKPLQSVPWTVVSLWTGHSFAQNWLLSQKFQQEMRRRSLFTNISVHISCFH